jgi:flagellar L-ring protein FlgH
MKVGGGVVGLTLLALLTGCGGRMNSLLDDPSLSPVGGMVSGDVTASTTAAVQTADKPTDTWQNGSADYFRDSRARIPGDLITVRIDVNDRATLNNSSNRSRKSNAATNADFDVGLLGVTGAGQGDISAGANSSASGQGSVVRSEKLSVSLAAMVREVLPNGTLLIEGTQEILVNSEKRSLKVSGIVDPRNILPDNSIGYSKIAEARIYYGGSGKVSDVQRPAWGLQLWDKISPF